VDRLVDQALMIRIKDRAPAITRIAGAHNRKQP
jgi:hypothetical protein